MLNTVKTVLETIGHAAEGIARTAAATTASASKTAGAAGLDAARSARAVGLDAAHSARVAGGHAAELLTEKGLSAAQAISSGAAVVGSAGAALLKRTPRRTLIGIAATAAAIGGAVYLVRYLRARGEAVHAAKSSESKKNVRATQANKRVTKKSAAHVHHN